MDEFRTTSDTEIIIMHMKAPRDLETKIFHRKYEAELEAQKKAINTKYENTIKSLKTNADAVMKEIFEAFEEGKQAAGQREDEAIHDE